VRFMDNFENFLPIIIPGLLIFLGCFLTAISQRRLEKKKRLSDYVQALKKILPNEQFTIVVWLPFFVISDEEADDVVFRTERTIDWAAKNLRAAFFKKDPPWTCIWLFKDQESYKTCMEKWHGKRRHLPGGFFSENSNAMVMDISLGNGVIVHEMVHAFMRANFPKCPTWFEEGLASLYNRCNEESGEICGHPDDYLKELQRTFCDQNNLPLAKLLAMSFKEFHIKVNEWRNYSLARHLCYYLQQEGLLKLFYHDFHENHHNDPTGFKTLKRVVGYEDMQQFQKDWEKFVIESPTPEPI
jgi:hypothetical protein